MLLLKTSEENSEAFVSTSSLDGEKNLKVKVFFIFKKAIKEF
jgi:magnesium-transporting ATPase (P-type)